MNSVESLSFDEYFHGSLKDQVLPNFPPRTLAQLVALVDEGKSDTISVLEWLEVIENESYWGGLTPSQELEACRAVWMIICTSSTLGGIAYFKAALAAQGQPSSMVQPLLASMTIVRGVQGLHQICVQKIDWITAIQNKDYAALAQACYQANVAPRKRIRQLMLPNANKYGERIIPHLADCTSMAPTESDQVWLGSCFQELKTTSHRVAFCDKILLNYGARLKQGVLLSLLEELCLPNSEYSLWYQLSDNALQKLKSLFNLTSFSELQAITNKLLGRDMAQNLSIPEEQQNQLRGRTLFWSNYSEKFDRLRVILPRGTKDLLEYSGLRFSEQVSVFKQQKANNVEVFIFGLGKLIVVEVLRGPISESRFYKNNKWNAERLFNSEFNSLDELRELAQVEVHDHVFLWQYYCEKLLRTQFKVTPNESLSNFAGLSRHKSRYSHSSGLAKPTLDRINERKEMLEIWLEKFWTCEFATTKYGKEDPKQNEGTLSLIKAQVYKQLGDSEKEHHYLKQASDSGNTEAKYRYGTSLIKGDAQARKEGERHMLESAKKGHKSAEEFIKKFGISEYAEKRSIFKKHLISLNKASKIWIGFHHEKGWVELDRNLIENRPESKGEMIFINMSKGEMFFEEKRNWKEPLFIFAPTYIDFASDKQLQELETIFTRYNIKIK
ncbi:hypothetical protein CTT30_08290 [Vibrio coralliilyticus]|nr:hypothetical protein J8Z27_08175 [Vibrio sp. SCSIO 43186]USD47123.1 hypothetical protein J4N38_08565 [Vibrio sp. SCSIO 43145]USD71177.1 hypothetical protein J4N41_08175 [Vibrio sp. SCSIO 43139]USD97462.1 hypothetical protein CTT30_08290 [Vibrio coralliilyticus]